MGCEVMSPSSLAPEGAGQRQGPLPRLSRTPGTPGLPHPDVGDPPQKSPSRTPALPADLQGESMKWCKCREHKELLCSPLQIITRDGKVFTGLSE